MSDDAARTLSYTQRLWVTRFAQVPWLSCERGTAEALAEAFDASVQRVGKGASVISEADGTVRLMVAGRSVAHVCSGIVTPCEDGLIGFAPSAIARLTDGMYRHWLDVLSACGAARGVAGIRVAYPLERSRKGYFTRCVTAVLRTFFGALPPGATHAFHRVQSTNPAILEWLTNGNAERRQQALHALPVPLMRLFGKHEAESLRAVMGEVGTLVDAGTELVPFLARRLRVSKAAVHRLSGVTVHRVGGAFLAMCFPIGALSLAPGDLRLQRREEYKAFAQVIEEFDRLSLTHPDMKRRLLADIAALPDQLLGWRNHPPERRQLQGLDDVLLDGRRYLRRLLAHDVYYDEDDPFASDLTAVIVGPRRLRGLARLNREWHAFVAAATATLRATLGANDEPTSRWAPAFPQGIPELGSGMAIVELVTEADLIEEGIALDHCVASYAEAAASGICRLLSVRDATGAPCSTVELTQDTQGNLRCAQHRGMTNALPSPDAIGAIEEVLKRVRAGEIQVSPQWGDAYTGSRVRALDTHAFWAERIDPARLAALRAVLNPHPMPEPPF